METTKTNHSPEVAAMQAELLTMLAEPAETPKPWTRMRPIGTRVLVRPEVAEEKTKGGILIPSTARTALPQGTVVAVGPGRTLESGDVVPVAVAVGERVALLAHRGADVEVGGENLLMVDEAEILGVLTEE